MHWQTWADTKRDRVSWRDTAHSCYCMKSTSCPRHQLSQRWRQVHFVHSQSEMTFLIHSWLVWYLPAANADSTVFIISGSNCTCLQCVTKRVGTQQSTSSGAEHWIWICNRYNCINTRCRTTNCDTTLWLVKIWSRAVQENWVSNDKTPEPRPPVRHYRLTVQKSMVMSQGGQAVWNVTRLVR